jgi:DNA gyrase subunit A
VIQETTEIKERHATPRRTVIIDSEDAAAGDGVITESDLRMPGSRQVVLLTTAGIERRDASGFRYSPAAGVTSRATTSQLVQVRAQPTDGVLLVSSRGRAWTKPVGFVPEKAAFRELGLDRGEAVVGVAVLPEADVFLVLGTRAGRIKRTNVADLALTPGHWSRVIALADGDDEVLVATVAPSGSDVLFATRLGQMLRIHGDDVNPQASGTARGVTGISLKRGDRLVAGAVVPGDAIDGTWVFIVSDKGFVKRVPLADYPYKGRATQGVQTLRITDQTGRVSAVAVGPTDAGLDILFGDGKRQHLPAAKVPAENRYNRGKQLVRLVAADGPVVRAVVL